MVTGKQDARVQALLDQCSIEEKQFCQPVLRHMLQLGYQPIRQKKGTFMLVFVKQGRIMSKMEIDRQNRLQFWLRFSANETYPALFHDALQRRPEAWVKRGKDWENYDKTACCGLCKGRPRYYRHANAAGKTIERCGGYTVPIPGASLRDVPEICAMIDRQDRYFAELLDDQPPTR